MTARRSERVADVLAGVASLWFAFAAFWGVNAQPHAGHIGSAGAAIAMTAENSIRWHSWYPLMDWYGKTNTFPQSAYCHHPFGVFWVSEILVRLFGHADFVPNLPAALMSACTPPLLYATAKRAWGPLPGAAAAIAFTTIPITVGFANFHNLEVMVIFGVSLFLFGHGRYLATHRTRDLLWSMLGLLSACSGDWAGYLLVGPLLFWVFVRAYVIPRSLTPPVHADSYHRWWAWSVALSVGTLVMWVALFKHADKLTDWISSAESRGGGSDQPLKLVLEARKTWIDFSFTPWVILIGKLTLPIAIARLLWRRRDEEMYSLAMLTGATGQYLAFKQGADVHIFWPQYFGLYSAFAAAQLVASVSSIAGAITSRVNPKHAPQAAFAAAATTLVIATLPSAPDAVRSLKIWRATAGKYDDKGTLFRSQADVLYVVKHQLRRRLPRGQAIGVHGSVPWGWEYQWALEGLSESADSPRGSEPFWIARASGLGADRLGELARKFHLRIYGDTVIVQRGEGHGPIDAYAVTEREPSFFEWMFTYNNEPVRRISAEPDPFLTWEWRKHYDEPANRPTQTPNTLEEIRIAYNAAIDAGDHATADPLLERIRAVLDRTVETHFTGNHELMGVRVTHGARPEIETYFLAGGPTPGDSVFSVRSDIIAKARFSLIPQSPVECDLAYPPPLSSKTWKASFVYVFRAPLHHRIGRERYWGMWNGGGTRLHGDSHIDLATED